MKIDKNILSWIVELIPIGRENAMSLEDLSSLLLCDNEKTAVHIDEVRRAGIPILYDDGYYFSTNRSDLLEFKSRVMREIEVEQDALNAVNRELLRLGEIRCI